MVLLMDNENEYVAQGHGKTSVLLKDIGNECLAQEQ